MRLPGFLRRWFRDRRRLIFRYHDGDAWVYADPLVVLRRLETADPDWRETVRRLVQLRRVRPGLSEGVRRAWVGEREVLAGRVGAMVRAAFVLKPLAADGSGLTEGEANDVLAAFLAFVADLGDRALPLASSGPPTEASPAPSTTEPSLVFTGTDTSSAS